MSYRKVFINPYPEGWIDLPNEDTSISAAALQAHTDAIEKMDSYLEKIGKAEDAGYIQMNMFNMSTVYIGKKLGDEGELVDDPGSMTTDFIEIDDKLQYMLSALNDSECLVKVHAYNNDFEWMMLCAMQTFYDNVVFPFAVANGAKYIKVSLSKDAKEVVLEDGYITHPYLPSNKELAAELSEQKESLIQFKDDGYLPKNLFNEDELLGGYFSTSGYNSTAIYSWAIMVVPIKSDKMALSGFPSDSGAYSAYLTPSKAFSKVAWGTESNNGVHDIDTSYQYIGICFRNNNASGFPNKMIAYGTDATYVPYAPSNTELKQSLAQKLGVPNYAQATKIWDEEMGIGIHAILTADVPCMISATNVFSSSGNAFLIIMVNNVPYFNAQSPSANMRVTFPTLILNKGDVLKIQVADASLYHPVLYKIPMI